MAGAPCGLLRREMQPACRGGNVLPLDRVRNLKGAGQLADEDGVGVRLCSTESMIQVSGMKRDPQLVPQRSKAVEQGARILSAGDGDENLRARWSHRAARDEAAHRIEE